MSTPSQRFLERLRRAGIDVLSRHRRDATDPNAVIQRVLSGRSVKTVFDCGARYGEMAVRFRAMFPTCKVYSFEPTPETFEVLKRNVGGDPNVEIVPAAVGEHNGTLNFYMNEDEQSNSLVKIREDAKVTQVKVIRLEDFCREKGIGHIDLFKIDVEGFELAALKRLERLLRAIEVDVVYTEVRFEPLGEGCTHFTELVSYLQGFGYRFMGFYAAIYQPDLRFDWGDIIMVSDRLLPRR